MKTLLLTALLTAACTSNVNSDPTFYGAPWSGTETTSLSCAATSTSTSNVTLSFAEMPGNEVTYSTSCGTFSLATTATGAMLTNGPVTCAANGYDVAITSSTWTLSDDGQHLTGVVSGSEYAVAEKYTCTFTTTYQVSR
jgi:hypothetical protein